MENHLEIVRKVILKKFGRESEKIEKMTTGLDNEVFSVAIGKDDYIVRLNQGDSLRGSSKYIPLFKSKDIKVPEIIFEDYSKEFIPFNYQILEKLEGVDIGDVIPTLTEEQLQGIARNIADIIKKLISLPTNGKFGYVSLTEEKLKSNLSDALWEMFDTVKKRNVQTGVVKNEYIEIFEKLLSENEPYFRKAPSQFYFDDMSSKNVIINKGEFNGLVDLDGVEYGDFLESVGRIKASWYGTKYGDYYTKAVMDNLELTRAQREIVTVYALLNRIYWQSEIGIQFNQNTSTQIDQNRVNSGNKIIDALLEEYKSLYHSSSQTRF